MKFPQPYALHDLFPEASGDQTITIAGITSPEQDSRGDLVVFFKIPTIEQLEKNKHAAAWIVPEGTDIPDHFQTQTYKVPRPRYSLMTILRRYISYQYPQETPEIHLTAIIHPDAIIAPGVAIGAYAIVEAGAYIGSGSVIGAHCFIGPRCVLEEEVCLDPHTQLYADVRVGSKTHIYAHSVIGMPGFGFEFEKGEWQHLPHCAGVEIGQRCVIGSHVSIAAGVIQPTIIGDDVIMDNHIHVAHQVQIKQGNALAACVGIAGSTTIEPYCQIGGGSMISGHLEIGPQVQITGMSMVNKSLTEPGRYSSGWPIEENHAWRRKVAALNRLPQSLKKMRHHEAGDE